MEIVLKAALGDGVEDDILARNSLQSFNTMRIPFQNKHKVEPFQPNEQTALLDATKQYVSEYEPRWFILFNLALHRRYASR